MKTASIVGWLPAMVATCWLCQSCEDEDQIDGVDTCRPVCGDGYSGGWPCGEMSTNSVAWDDPSELGRSPEQAFSAIAGTCTSILTWDATGFAPREIEPSTGESEITVMVEFDQSSASAVTWEFPSASSSCIGCLEVEGTVHLWTADGTFDDTAEVTLASYGWSIPLTLSFEKSVDELGGTLSVALDQDESARLGYSLDGAGESCSGEVWLTIRESLGGGAASDVSSILGSWSNTSCAMGSQPLDLTEASGNSGSLLQQIEQAWGDVSFDGEWDDGQQTTLEMQVTVQGDSACRSDGQAVLPAQVDYGTTDGRLEQYVALARLEISIEADGSLRTSTVEVNDERTCADENDSLAYTLNSCASLRSILIQLRIQRFGDGSVGASDEGLAVYEYDRSSTAPPGAADRVRTLYLFP